MMGYQQHALRELDTQLCTSNRAFNTTYNGDKDVPPYVGIMFEMTAFSDLDVLTFELDIRWDLNPTDLSVEVYTLAGSYDKLFHQPDAWDQLAATNLVLAPEGNSAVIPVADFKTLHVPAREKRSFYVTMKGPFLDQTVYGLQKTGDVHVKGDDLQLLVGSGFTSYKFPDAIDTVLHPQFAGIVHYKKSFACDDTQASTTNVEFQLIFEKNELDGALVSNTNAAIGRAVGGLLESNANLRSFVEKYGLQMRSAPETMLASSTYPCPDNWVACPSAYMNTKITFVHQDTLDSGDVLYEIFLSTTSIIDAALSGVTDGAQVLYLGYGSTETAYSVTLTGVPAGKEMDEVQVKFFKGITERFLKAAAETVVFGLQVDEQLLSGGSRLLRRSLGEGDTVELRGVVRGAIPAGKTARDFDLAVDKAFRQSKAMYLSLLTQSGIRPDEIYQGGGFEYFRDIKGVSGLASVSDDAAIVSSSSGQSISSVGIAIFGSISGVLLLVGFYLFFRHKRNEKARYRDVDQYRQDMRERRRALRLDKTMRQLSIDSLDESSKQVKLDENKSLGSVDVSTDNNRALPTSDNREVRSNPSWNAARAVSNRTLSTMDLCISLSANSLDCSSASLDQSDGLAAQPRLETAETKLVSPSTERVTLMDCSIDLSASLAALKTKTLSQKALISRDSMSLPCKPSVTSLSSKQKATKEVEPLASSCDESYKAQEAGLHSAYIPAKYHLVHGSDKLAPVLGETTKQTEPQNRLHIHRSTSVDSSSFLPGSIERQRKQISAIGHGSRIVQGPARTTGQGVVAVNRNQGPPRLSNRSLPPLSARKIAATASSPDLGTVMNWKNQSQSVQSSYLVRVASEIERLPSLRSSPSMCRQNAVNLERSICRSKSDTQTAAPRSPFRESTATTSSPIVGTVKNLERRVQGAPSLSRSQYKPIARGPYDGKQQISSTPSSSARQTASVESNQDVPHLPQSSPPRSTEISSRRSLHVVQAADRSPALLKLDRTGRAPGAPGSSRPQGNSLMRVPSVGKQISRHRSSPSVVQLMPAPSNQDVGSSSQSLIAADRSPAVCTVAKVDCAIHTQGTSSPSRPQLKPLVRKPSVVKHMPVIRPSPSELKPSMAGSNQNPMSVSKACQNLTPRAPSRGIATTASSPTLRTATNVGYKAQPLGAAHVRVASVEKRLPPPRSLSYVSRSGQSTTVHSNNTLPSLPSSSQTALPRPPSRGIAATASSPATSLGTVNKTQGGQSLSRPQDKTFVRAASIIRQPATVDSSQGMASVQKANEAARAKVAAAADSSPVAQGASNPSRSQGKPLVRGPSDGLRPQASGLSPLVRQIAIVDSDTDLARLSSANQIASRGA